MGKSFNLILMIVLSLWVTSCMKMEGLIPSRVAITNFEGEDVNEITLAEGMTHRLYSGVYLSSQTGDQYVGSAFDGGHVTDAAYEVIGDNSGPTVLLQKEGCLRAQKKGDILIRLSAFSLKKGGLDAFSVVRVNALTQIQPTLVKTGVTHFSSSQLKDRSIASGGTLYGLTINDRFHLLHSNGTRILSDREGNALEAQLSSGESVSYPHIWADRFLSGFFVGYGKKSSQKDHLTTISFHKNGGRIPGLFNSAIDLDIQKIVGSQYVNGIPVSFALTQNKDAQGNPSTFSLFALSYDISNTQSPIQEGYILDQAGKKIEFTESVQFGKDSQGISYFALGQDRIKVISVDKQKGIMIDTPDAMTVDQPKSFGFDVDDGIPKIIFIKNNKLLFSQKISGGWVLAFQELAIDCDPAFSPQLVSNKEDNTWAIIWRTMQNHMKLRISKDRGNHWMDALLLPENPSFVKILALPCGGTVLLTVENSIFKLRFLDDVQRQFSAPLTLGTLSSPMKDFSIFRDDEHLRMFYLLENGELYFLPII